MAVSSLVNNNHSLQSSHWRLALGLLSAIFIYLYASAAAADQQPAPGEMLWSCVSVDDGEEWECTVNEEREPTDSQAQTEPPPVDDNSQPELKAESTVPPAATETAKKTETVDPDADADLEAEYGAAPVPQTLEPSAAPEKRKKSSDRWQSQNRYSRNQSQYECQAVGDSWDCTDNPQPASPAISDTSDKNYLAAYPDAYPDKIATSSKTDAPTTQARSQQEWDCKPTEDQLGWDCQPIAQKTASSSVQVAKTSAPTPYPYAFLDWYEFSDGPNPQTHCPGQYIEPTPLYTQAELSEGEKPVYLRANQTSTREGSVTHLEGNIHLQKGNQQLRSQTAQLYHDEERAEFQGTVLFREPGTLLLGDRAVFDQNRGETEIENAKFVMHESHARGTAQNIVRYDNGDTFITEGSYTRCEPGYDGWVLHADEIALYEEEGQGIAKHATLRIGSVPVFYLPVISFPIDDRRKSGFLIPSFSISEDNGLDITAPYYFNLAPHYDLTLAPRYVEKRGLMVESEFRYLHPTAGQFDFSLAALPSDDLLDGEDRWVLGIQHSGRPAAGWRSSIDFTRVSDNDYFDDLDTSLNISQETHLDQRGSLSYSGNGWSAGAKVHAYQTITTASEPYQKLPELYFNGGQTLSDDAVELSYSAEYTRFDRDITGFTGTDRITGSRAHLDATIASEYSWPWAFVRPKLRLTHTAYNLDNQPSGNDANPNRSLPLFSIDSGIYLDRETEFGGKAYTHTLEPRLFYLYVPEEDQTDLPDFDSSELTFSYSQLFRDNRFSGKDRIGDTNQITLGLSTRLMADNGQELMYASVGQIFYFEDRQVRLRSSDPILTDSTSDFAAEAGWRITDNMRLTADGQWENDDFSNTKRNLKLSYKSDLDHQFNFSYRFTRNDLEQTDLSFIWPINAQWSVLARWLQDIENSESLDTILGLEYENCCWRIRTVYREWIDDDADDRENSGIFLQFTMKGLGSFGTKAAGDSGPQAKNFLEDITGFKSRENID